MKPISWRGIGSISIGFRPTLSESMPKGTKRMMPTEVWIVVIKFTSRTPPPNERMYGIFTALDMKPMVLKTSIVMYSFKRTLLLSVLNIVISPYL